MNFISSHSNNIHALEQLRGNKNKAASMPQFVKKMLVNLPFNCQSQSPSPYFDQSLFQYDEKLISATDRHRQSADHPIKFSSRRQQNNLKFKIKTGTFIQVNFMPPLLVLRFETDFLSGLIITDLKLEALIVEGKKICSFLFHPVLPLAISIQQTLFLQPAAVNVHFHR
ncbi:Hypothetical predicted protein [Olea europaea subsp. europaea]|uniref:Uncharacterized protein n=1 Tax=Olea europaea subsp. europaea TaxID=158383 RepID=A0A8S0RT65_OLEEU|nr:Hypothetical predicted protein [Olea europaea subsp. europaea]